jgi:hypothetical protein
VLHVLMFSLEHPLAEGADRTLFANQQLSNLNTRDNGKYEVSLPASPLGISKPRPVRGQVGSAQMKEGEIRPGSFAQGIQSLGRQGSSNGLPVNWGYGVARKRKLGVPTWEWRRVYIAREDWSGCPSLAGGSRHIRDFQAVFVKTHFRSDNQEEEEAKFQDRGRSQGPLALFRTPPDSVNVITILRQIMTVCRELRIREDRLA